MLFETSQFFLQALARHGLTMELESYSEESNAADRVSFPIPPEHSKILSFATELLNCVSQSRGILMMPTDWGIWRSSENWHLYEALRRCCGNEESLREKPCHIFSAAENDLALDYCYLFLLFSWDFYVFGYRDDDVLFLSHDGFGVYYSPQRVELIRSEMEKMFEGGDLS